MKGFSAPETMRVSPTLCPTLIDWYFLLYPAFRSCDIKTVCSNMNNSLRGFDWWCGAGAVVISSATANCFGPLPLITHLCARCCPLLCVVLFMNREDAVSQSIPTSNARQRSSVVVRRNARLFRSERSVDITGHINP